MIKEQLEKDEMEWLLSLPAFQLARKEGLKKDIEQGIEQGREQGIEQGTLHTLRQAILKGVVRLFRPDVEDYVAFEEKLRTITDITLLNHMFNTTFKAQNFEEVQALLSD